MPTERLPLRRPPRGRLTASQEQELWLGPSPHLGPLFADAEHVRAAWFQHRARLLELFGSHGRRPQAWWAFEAQIKYPGPDRERSKLYEAGLLVEAERAELLAYWREEFDRAHGPDFFCCMGPGRSSMVPPPAASTSGGPTSRARWSRRGGRRPTRAGPSRARDLTPTENCSQCLTAARLRLSPSPTSTSGSCAPTPRPCCRPFGRPSSSGWRNCCRPSASSPTASCRGHAGRHRRSSSRGPRRWRSTAGASPLPRLFPAPAPGKSAPAKGPPLLHNSPSL